MSTVCEEITDDLWLWIGVDRGDYVVEIYQKVDGGVRYFIGRYPQLKPCQEIILADAKKRGVFSPRPYELGQGCDGSTHACVLTLYHRFCLDHSLDPIQLYRQAYQEHDGPRYEDPDFNFNIRAAEWEGVAYPDQWDFAALQGLLKSLYAINCRSLVAVLEETSPYLQQGPMEA